MVNSKKNTKNHIREALGHYINFIDQIDTNIKIQI